MSQQITDIGRSPSLPESDFVQQHDAESFVRELLHEAPAPMERELDKAREMAAVPERDIADDILAQRNEETGEALAGRTLARALEQDDTAAVRETAEKLEGRAFTPQMQSLMKQADICVSAPEKKPSAGGVEAPAPGISTESLPSEEASAPSEADADGTPDAAPDALSSPKAAPLPEDVPAPETSSGAIDATKNARDTPVSEKNVQPDAPTENAAPETLSVEEAPTPPESMLPDARLRELAVPEGLFTILRDFKPTLLSSGKLSLEAMFEYDATLSQLIQNTLFDDETDSCGALLLLRLMETQMQLHNSMESRMHLNERLADLDALTHRRDSSPEQKLDALADLILVYRNGLEQTKAMQEVEAGNPQRLQDAAQGAGTGTGIVGDDLDLFESALTTAVASALRLVQPGGKDALDDEALRVAARLSLHTGERPETLLDTLLKGTAWASSAEHRSALVKTLAATLPESSRTPSSLSSGDIMRHVDMVFQGAYPEFSDSALDLKKMLLPGHEEEAALQHECTVAGRQLLDMLFSGEGPSGKTRADTVDRAARGVTAGSLRSFVLTPDMVNALTQKVDIPDFNFHLAHVAVLQKRAAERGLFPVPDEVLTGLGSEEGWYRALQLEDGAAAYAEELDRRLDAPEDGELFMRRLQQACDLFVKGFHGQTEISEAGRIIRKHANLTGTSGAARREMTLYEGSAEYMARLALDHHIVNLTGLIRPEERFADDDGMALNGEAVDRAMLRHTAELYERIFDKDTPDNVGQGLTRKARARRELLNELQTFESHAGVMTRMARSTGEGVHLRAAMEKDEALVKAMEQDKALLRFTWPHRRSERTNVSKTVLEIEALTRDLAALSAHASEEERESIRRDIQSRLKTLKGISPFTLASSLRLRGETPSLETVLEHMLPRARALQFFEAKIYVNGLPSTRARETLRRIEEARSRMDALQKDVDRGMDTLRKQFGSDNIRQLQQTVTAALYKVFVESGQSPAAFSISDVTTSAAVRGQLRAWGLRVDEALTRQLIHLTLTALTSPDGRLRESVLRREAEKTDLDFAGKKSAEEMKTSLRREGKNVLSARRQTRDFINNSLLSDERRRSEGVRALLREASLPGSGFVYDRSRGLVIDTGAVFMPFTSPSAPVNLLNVAHPLSARLRLMHNDSMTVSNVGNGCYQVMLKGGLAASLGATMKTAVPGTPLTLVTGVNATGRDDKGLALTFKNEQDCAAFLNAFMKPDSALHKGTKEQYHPSVWLSASQIRFIDGYTVSGDISAGLMDSIFKKMLGRGFVGTGSGVTTMALAGDMTRREEHSATGEAVTFSVKGRVTLSASASLGLVHGTISAGSPKTTKVTAETMDIEQRFKVVTGPQGLMPSCCAETECMVGPLKKSVMHDITRRLLLPSDVRSRISKDIAFSDAFEKLIRGLPPTAKLIVHRDLRPGALEKARELLTRARMAENTSERQKALEEAHGLLASFDSYVPTRINVVNVAPADIAENWSPGLGAFQYARNTSFLRMRGSAPLTIDLPQE